MKKMSIVVDFILCVHYNRIKNNLVRCDFGIGGVAYEIAKHF